MNDRFENDEWLKGWNDEFSKCKTMGELKTLWEENMNDIMMWSDIRILYREHRERLTKLTKYCVYEF
jgi:hypothetical protein